MDDEAHKLRDTTALAQLSYELSLRTLTRQEAVLNELRARTGTLIAAAALVASFLGGTAISGQGVDAWGVAALFAFVASIALATWVLLPKEHLVFSIRGSDLFEDEVRAGVFDIGQTHRRLAYWLDAHHSQNQQNLDALFACYRWSTALVLIESFLWSVQLAVR